MSEAQVDQINVLKLSLYERLVGYLAGFQGGRNVLSFADDFKNNAGRPTFSLNSRVSIRLFEEIINHAIINDKFGAVLKTAP
ncbi:hypothetical protein [Nitrincola tapanii]|uniref:hypothetical protein n=1 Tax=Nitrincola tapanii TaxID=1708751 RepID=UPI00190F2E06|nr:hypothetical protein [Nitrincola tapanii]